MRPSASQHPKHRRDRRFAVSSLINRITATRWIRGAQRRAARTWAAQTRAVRTRAAHLAPVVRRLLSAPTTGAHGIKAVAGVLAVAVALAAPAYAAVSSSGQAHPGQASDDDEGTPTFGALGFGQVTPSGTYRPASSAQLDQAALGTPPRSHRSEAATTVRGEGALPAAQEPNASQADGAAPDKGGAVGGGKVLAETAPTAKPKQDQPEAAAAAQSEQAKAAAKPEQAKAAPKPTPTKNPYAAHEVRFGRDNKWVRVKGMDVASHQGYVDWDYWWKEGKRFVFIKATEGTSYINPFYEHAWKGSRKVGMLRGAYHFARPDTSSGSAQAKYFVANGGGGKGDGWTLPGVLDIEFGEAVGVATCYNRSPQFLTNWIDDFVTTYEKLTGRKAIIYTNTSWWHQCVGSHKSFKDNPLWIANYDGQVGALPPGWETHTFWQYTDTPLDQNYFKGSYAKLKEMASK